MLTRNYINSLVIDTLCEQAYGQNIAVLSLYCDYQAQKDQSAVNMIGGLLRQISLGSVGNIGRRNLTSLWEVQARRWKRSPNAGDAGIIRQNNWLPQASIYLHRLNGRISARTSVGASPRATTDDRIRKAPNTRLFLTGRPHIRGELDKHLTKGAYTYTIHIVPQRDIARYITQKIDDAGARDPDLIIEGLKK